MTPDSALDTAYRFFGDAAVASMITFLMTRFISTRYGNVAKQLVAAVRDGKVTAEEIDDLKEALR
ncbi:MAG: hypothetical protein AAGF66_21215 [Cyanobacteria bacterium P01_H01_bin.119]